MSPKALPPSNNEPDARVDYLHEFLKRQVETVEMLRAQVAENALEIAIVKTKMAFVGAFFGLFGGIAGSIISAIVVYKLKNP